MAPDSEPGETPWYRTTAAVFAAGAAGAVLVTGLVVAVVQMSDEWSQPTDTVLTTAVSTTTPSSTRERQPFIITPTDTSTTFTTSVPLSTTEIAGPTDPSPSETTSPETTPGSATPPTPTTRELPTTFPNQRRPGDSDHAGDSDDSGDDTPTTRHRPRYNETRTYSPG